MYKIFRIGEGKLTSLYLSSLSISYPKKKWTYPKMGKIFVFDTLENAFGFAQMLDCPYEIWEVDVKDVSACKKLIALHPCDTFHYWHFDLHHWLMSLTLAPPGTFWAEAIKPIRKAKYDRLPSGMLVSKE